MHLKWIHLVYSYWFDSMCLICFCWVETLFIVFVTVIAPIPNRNPIITIGSITTRCVVLQTRQSVIP